jgi:hypothetical protein
MLVEGCGLPEISTVLVDVGDIEVPELTAVTSSVMSV